MGPTDRPITPTRPWWIPTASAGLADPLLTIWSKRQAAVTSVAGPVLPHDCDRAAGRRPVDQMAARGPKQRRCRSPTLLSNATAVGQERPRWRSDVSAQIVQPSDALGATDPLAQRTLPRSASKHPNCRSGAGAGVDHADHIAAELERHPPPPGRGRDCWFVAIGAVLTTLLLQASSSRLRSARKPAATPLKRLSPRCLLITR